MNAGKTSFLKTSLETVFDSDCFSKIVSPAIDSRPLSLKNYRNFDRNRPNGKIGLVASLSRFSRSGLEEKLWGHFWLLGLSKSFVAVGYLGMVSSQPVETSEVMKIFATSPFNSLSSSLLFGFIAFAMWPILHLESRCRRYYRSHICLYSFYWLLCDDLTNNMELFLHVGKNIALLPVSQQWGETALAKLHKYASENN